jgi:hypothetical protein
VVIDIRTTGDAMNKGLESRYNSINKVNMISFIVAVIDMICNIAIFYGL